ncbi:hypothetical protein CPC08DRAFT_650165, partial [Agrocybe pediades]
MDHETDNNEQVNSLKEARQYLESKFMLTPSETSPTPDVITAILLQIAALPGVNSLTKKAIRAAALMTEAMETATTTKNAISEQINNIKEEMNNVTEHIKTTIAEQMKAVETSTREMLQQMKDNISTPTQNSTWNHGQRSYSEVTRNGPTNDKNREADPRLMAREAIKARQYLLDFPPDSIIHKTSATEIMEICKKALKESYEHHEQNGIRSVERLNRSKGILIEFSTKEGAQWMKINDNANRLLQAMGQHGHGGQWKKRSHNIIAYYAPVEFNPEDPTHIEELLSVNKISKDELIRTRYAKPIHRRHPQQRFAHLILTIANADTANTLINEGMNIFGKRTDVRKCKKEPIRCLKCQTYNHLAKECINQHDTCGTCGSKEHRTQGCNNTTSYQCVPCGGLDHPSWSRHCPTFLRKCEDYDKMHPENNIPYFPSEESWTWNNNFPPPNVRHAPETQVMPEPSPSRSVENPKQKLKQTTLSFGLVDTPRTSTPLQQFGRTVIDPNPLNRLRILQINLNKSEKGHHDLMNRPLKNDYDLILIQEPYITKTGIIRTPNGFSLIYPQDRKKDANKVRTVIMVSTNLETSTWKEINVPGDNDITIIQI